MKKLIALAILLVACQTTAPRSVSSPRPAGVSASSATGALTAFLGGAKAQDIQAMAAVWGTSEGPAGGQKTRQELEQGLYYNMKCLRNDSFKILDDSQGPAGARILNVQITRGSLSRTTRFTTVAGPENKWYVNAFDPKPVSDLCMSR